MAAPPPPPPSKTPFSLYDNLLDPNDPAPQATISSAPVLYGQAESAAEAKKSLDPALRFQPIRRLPVKQAAKAKGTAFPKPIPASNSVGTADLSTNAAQSAPHAPMASTASTAGQPAKSTLADWAATEEDEWRYGVGEKRQRGGRKKKKKLQQIQAETDWDEIYDPARPTNIDEYLKSDEKIDEVREWKALLYRHRKKADESDISDDEDDDSRPVPSSKCCSSLRDRHFVCPLLTQVQTNSHLPLHTPSYHHPLNHHQQRRHQMKAPMMPTPAAWPCLQIINLHRRLHRPHKQTCFLRLHHPQTRQPYLVPQSTTPNPETLAKKAMPTPHHQPSAATTKMKSESQRLSNVQIVLARPISPTASCPNTAGRKGRASAPMRPASSTLSGYKSRNAARKPMPTAAGGQNPGAKAELSAPRAKNRPASSAP